MEKIGNRGGNNGLFPATWVVGEAAADLAKNDAGVLLANPGRAPGVVNPEPAAAVDPDAPPAIPDPAAVASARLSDERAPSASAAPAPESSGDDVASRQGPAAGKASRDREIAELHAENERLRRRITLTHRRPEVPFAATSRTGGLDVLVEPPFPDFSTTSRKRAGGRRWLIAAMVVLVSVGLVGAWSINQRLEALDGPYPQRVEQLRSEIVADFSEVEMGALVSDARAAAERMVDDVTAYGQAGWQALEERLSIPAPEPADNGPEGSAQNNR